MKRIILWSLFILFFCSCLLSVSGPIRAEKLADEKILGGREDEDPLKITADSQGNLSVSLWQHDQPFSVNQSYISQYKTISTIFGDSLVQWGSQLRLLSEDNRDHVLATPFYSWSGQDPDSLQRQDWQGHLVSQEISDGYQHNLWHWSDPGLDLIQEINYIPGSWSFTIHWTVHNSGSQPLSQLSFLHGGDTDLYGDELARTSRHPDQRQLVLWPQQIWDHGLMLMGGLMEMTADHYFGGSYIHLQDHARSGNLPDSTDPIYRDSGLQLQWLRPSLLPGESWTIACRQQWTPPGIIQVLAPETITAAPGSQITWVFPVAYLGDAVSLPQLSVSLQEAPDWNWQLELTDSWQPDDTAGCFWQEITLKASIPADSGENLYPIKLNIMHEHDPYTRYTGTGYIQVAGDPLPGSEDQQPVSEPDPDPEPSSPSDPQPTAVEPTETEALPDHPDPNRPDHPAETSTPVDPTTENGWQPPLETEKNPDSGRRHFESAGLFQSGPEERMHPAMRLLAILSIALIGLSLLLWIKNPKDQD